MLKVRHLLRSKLQLEKLWCGRHASSVPPAAKVGEFIPRRAVLYVPGSDERKLLKVPKLDVDCVVMDCEDGVAMNRKV